MTEVCSSLILESRQLELITNNNYPVKIYRGFSEKDHMLSFLDGNFWFAGDNHLRFFLDNPDRLEYQNTMHTHNHAYPISFSMDRKYIMDNYNNVIEVSNTNLFLSSLADDLRDSNLNHAISWISRQELQVKVNSVVGFDVEKKRLLDILANINDRPFSNEVFNMRVTKLSGYMVTYVDKFTHSKKQGDSIEIALNAINKNIDFSYEKEFRVKIDSSSFYGAKDISNINILVKYLKLKCPRAAEHCEILKN